MISARPANRYCVSRVGKGLAGVDRADFRARMWAYRTARIPKGVCPMAFFLASDGLLYRNPLVRGDGWFVVFDGDDDPELVIAADGPGAARLDTTQARLRAVSILEQSGLSAAIEGASRLMMRPFEADGTDSRDSYCFWLAVEEPIPAALLSDRDDGVATLTGDAVVHSFGQPWGDVA